jgi:hypothetical protein
MRLNALLLGFLGLIGSGSASISAQAVSSAPEGPIRVALVLSEGTTTSTEVLRHAKRGPKNVVLVKQDATAEDLAAALRLMSALRIQYGDLLAHDVRARVQSSTLSPEWAQSEYRLWLIQQLERLRASPRRKVGDLGTARAVLITLPARKATITFNSSPKK